MNFEKIGRHRIYFDQIYYIAYAGGQRGVPEKDLKEYNNILRLPLILKQKELQKFGFDRNPNVIPIKGIILLEFIKDLDFTPFFDQYFEQSHLIQLNDLIIYESIKQKSYDIALKKENNI